MLRVLFTGIFLILDKWKLWIHFHSLYVKNIVLHLDVHQIFSKDSFFLINNFSKLSTSNKTNFNFGCPSKILKAFFLSHLKKKKESTYTYLSNNSKLLRNNKIPKSEIIFFITGYLKPKNCIIMTAIFRIIIDQIFFNYLVQKYQK